MKIDKKVLWAIAIEVQESLKDKLNKEHGKDTGELQSGIIATVEGNEIIITMPEHAKYVEWGTAPHFPPPKELVGWIQRKWNVSADEAEKKAWLLAHAIAKRGTRPFPFIRNTFDNDVLRIVKKNLNNAEVKI